MTLMDQALIFMNFPLVKMVKIRKFRNSPSHLGLIFLNSPGVCEIRKIYAHDFQFQS